MYAVSSGPGRLHGRGRGGHRGDRVERLARGSRRRRLLPALWLEPHVFLVDVVRDIFRTDVSSVAMVCPEGTTYQVFSVTVRRPTICGGVYVLTFRIGYAEEPWTEDEATLDGPAETLTVAPGGEVALLGRVRARDLRHSPRRGRRGRPRGSTGCPGARPSPGHLSETRIRSYALRRGRRSTWVHLPGEGGPPQDGLRDVQGRGRRRRRGHAGLEGAPGQAQASSTSSRPRPRCG